MRAACLVVWLTLNSSQWRMQDVNKGGLNNEDLGLELESNGDFEAK